MPHGPPIPLAAAQVGLNSLEYRAICDWPFADEFVGRLLRHDVPQRATFGNCSVWTYRDPGGSLIGFGTLDVSEDCRAYTNGRLHPYIPVLAINPTVKSFGYGTSIVRHLIDESALLALRGACHDVLFLDVYAVNAKAIAVYASLGFQQVSAESIPDPAENGEQYIIMGRRLSVDVGTRPPTSLP